MGPQSWSLQCRVQLGTVHMLTPWDIPWLQFLTPSRRFLLITEDWGGEGGEFSVLREGHGNPDLSGKAMMELGQMRVTVLTPFLCHWPHVGALDLGIESR